MAFVNRGEDIETHSIERISCRTCGGSGEIDIEHSARMEKGAEMRRARIAKRVSMKEEAAARGITAAELSRIENGDGPAEAYA